jgi:hypothetical protein
MDIKLILAKTERLKNIFKEQFETKVYWTKLVMMKHKKDNLKKKGGGGGGRCIPSNIQSFFCIMTQKVKIQ